MKKKKKECTEEEEKEVNKMRQIVCEHPDCLAWATCVSNINPQKHLCDFHATERTKNFISVVASFGGFV